MTKRLTGLNTLAYLGVNAPTPPNYFKLDRAPTANDYTNFNIGDFWLDTDSQVLYNLTNKDDQAATWSNFGGGTGASSVVTDAGTATASGGSLNAFGGTNINTAGSGSTITVNLDPSVSLAGTLTVAGNTQVTTGNLVVSTGTISTSTAGISSATTLVAGSSVSAGTTVAATTTVTGGTGLIATTGNVTASAGDLVATLGALSVKTGAEITDFSAGVLQTDASGVFSSDNGANGQVLVGGGAAPAWANITSTDGSVTVSNGANTIDLAVSGSGAFAQVDTDSGSAVPAAGVLQVLGGSDIATSGSGNTITIAIDGPISVANGGTGDTTLTDHGVLVGSGTGGITALTPGTDGQVLIAATGADPAFAAITSTGGTITFTPGANTLNMEVASYSFAFNFTAIDNTDSPYTVLTTDQYISVDSSTDVVTLELPNAPDTGKVYVVKDSNGSSASNNITVTTVGGVVTIDGDTSYVLNNNYQAINLLFNGSSYEVF